ncbi:MAG TPA: DUF5694 domain-containing protein [Longimicrobiaceae bacterium]|nr:DUF5694 domain-containing protein [Longimicrobiaceae bacterium]
MMRSTAAIVVLTLWTIGALPTGAQQSPAERPAAPGRAEVLVLGVYHMSNPGRDIFNTQADDVLAPRRQAEIAQVVAALRRFQPTKIAVERDFSDSRIARSYADYLAGRHELTRNEVEQIGFRLAREFGHQTVYAVDADGEFPYQHLVNYARASGRSNELNALMDEIGRKVKAQNEYLASHTVLETLLYLNSDESVAEDVGFYYRKAQLGEHWDWAGADLVSDWFRRNMRIYSNIAQLVDSPNDRVLVIFGAGHLGWLQGAFESNPNFRLRKLAEFAR